MFNTLIFLKSNTQGKIFNKWQGSSDARMGFLKYVDLLKTSWKQFSLALIKNLLHHDITPLRNIKYFIQKSIT